MSLLYFYLPFWALDWPLNGSLHFLPVSNILIMYVSTYFLQIKGSVVLEIFSSYPGWCYICFKWKYFKEQFSQMNTIGISAEGADKTIAVELNLLVIWRAWWLLVLLMALISGPWQKLSQAIGGSGGHFRSSTWICLVFSDTQGIHMCKQSQQTHENIGEQQQSVSLVFEKSHLHGEWRNSKPRVNFYYKFHPLHITIVWHHQKSQSSQKIDCYNLYN